MNPRAGIGEPCVSMRERRAMSSGNALKIGLFGANCSSGRCVTTVPERWTGSWEDCLALALMCDERGIEFMLPVGRWKGYGGDTDYMGTALETVTWATGLLASTRRLVVFGTVHAPLFHPLIAAKQFVTADRVSGGRFGLNLVVGWNEDEFEMFGVTQREHEERYEYAQEWLDAVKRAWGTQEDFAYDGNFIKLRRVRAKPKPYGGSRPLIMNAGASPTGRAFAIRNCDAFFTQAERTSIDVTRRRVAAAKDEARAQGRDLDVYAVGVVTCRATQKEAEEYYRHATIEMADWSAVDGILARKNITAASVGAEAFERQRHHFAHGLGGLLMVGDPDRIAGQLAELSHAGLRGIGISFVNYLDELPYFCDEVLPRLERLGIREKPARGRRPIAAAPQARVRLGLIIPSANTCSEPQFNRFAPPGLSIHAARARIAGRWKRPLPAMRDEIAAAARLLADACPDVIVFHCTDTSMAQGPEGEGKILDIVREASGTEAMATSRLVLSALQTLGIKRVVLLSPYKKNEAVIDYLAASGVAVATELALGLDAEEFGAVTPADWVRLARENDRPEADGVFLACTNTRQIEAIADIERALGKPVVNSNQAVLWGVIRRFAAALGPVETMPGLGRLLERPE